MIIKVKSFKKPDFNKLLEYMLHDENRLYDNENRSFLITHNLKGRNINKWVEQYLENEKFRKRKRKDSVKLTHEIISFHKDDTNNITLDKLENITREYINKRNLNGMYVAVPHFDKEHYHIHICASGVEYRIGKSLRMSKAGFQKLKREIQKYQIEQYPELSKSVVAHDKKGIAYKKEKEYQQKLRTGRLNKKGEVIKVIEQCLNSSKSKDAFYKKLKDSGLEIYKRSGKITGVIYEKMKFRFNRLGFTEEKMEALSKLENRAKELNETRGKKERIISRNR